MRRFRRDLGAGEVWRGRRAHRTASSSWSVWSARGGGAREREEHLVERRLAHAEVVDLDAGVGERHGGGGEGGHAAARRHGGAARPLVDLRLGVGGAAEDRRGAFELRRLADDDLELVAADAALELASVALGDHAAVVDDDDVVGEPLGLLEVLRGEEQRGATPHQAVEHRPELVAARGRARWWARRGTAPQDEPRSSQRDPAAAHTAGVVAGEPVGGIGEREVLEQVDGPLLSGGATQVVELARASRGSHDR